MRIRSIYPPASADLSPMRRMGQGMIARHGSGGSGSSSSGSTSFGTGSPEGVATADRGSVYVETDAGRTWYKESGDGTNTGWRYDMKSTVGTGDPNGAVIGRPGDLFYSSDLLIKFLKGSGESTNTGWV